MADALRAIGVIERGSAGAAAPPIAVLSLAHDERHLRRKRLPLPGGGAVLVDLPQAVALQDGDRLLLEDGRTIAIEAAPELLYEIHARDRLHLCELAWHLGNRHLPAQIEEDRILILADHVIRAMVEGLGGHVHPLTAAFTPLRGAYHAHAEAPAPGDAHHDHHHHHHDHPAGSDHAHGGPDRVQAHDHDRGHHHHAHGDGDHGGDGHTHGDHHRHHHGESGHGR